VIRINLLPVKAERRREAARIQLIFGAVTVGAMLVALMVWHGVVTAETEDLAEKKKNVETVVTKLKKEVGDYDLVKAQRENLLRQKDAIQRLQQSRSGPAYFLRELSHVLTQGKGPTFNHMRYEETLRRDPNAAINLAWDPKRVWLISYVEKDRQVQMQVGAKSDDDVAEFLKRLKLSAFFSEVYWKQTQPQVDSKLNVSYVTFDVDCKVTY